jgi:hypothetical protein
MDLKPSQTNSQISTLQMHCECICAIVKFGAICHGCQDWLSPQLLPRSEALSGLSFNSPISSPQDVRSWFETKGWILSSEQYTKPKLADILFMVATDTKIPPESKSAIMAVAYLIEDIAEEDFAASILEKIITKIDGALSNLTWQTTVDITCPHMH